VTLPSLSIRTETPLLYSAPYPRPCSGTSSSPGNVCVVAGLTSKTTRVAEAMQAADDNRRWSEEAALRVAGLETKLADRIDTLQQDLGPKADEMAQVVVRAQELAERYELVRARTGLEKLETINRIHERLAQVEAERRAELDQMQERLDALKKGLDEEAERRIATNSEVKRGLEVLNDRVLLIEQKGVS
jgi:hypothetical protein